MKSYDVIVIGGGLQGSSCAYQLSKRGHKVAIIEQNDVASGTASHTDGYVGFSEKAPGIDALQGWHSVKLYHELQHELSYEIEFEPTGFMYVCETEREFAAASDYAKKIRDQGFDMTVIDPKEMCELEPNLAPDLVGGILNKSDGLANPYRVVFAFVNEAKRNGADVYTHTTVTDIKRNAKGEVEGVVTDRGDFLAPKVVNACGVWAPFIGKMVGLEIPIEPRKGMLLITEKAEPVTQSIEVLEFGYWLAKFFADFKRPVSELVEKHNVCLNIETTMSGNTVVGGCRLFKGYDIKSEYEIMQAIAERAIRFYPMLKDMHCIRSFGGVRPFCLDHLPIVSGVDEVPGFYIAAGHEGDGVALAPITGLLIAQIISGEETPFDASPLAWKRFEGVDLATLAEHP
ncbi:MAG: FAD-binding oxidoreductase [Clostridiales Family XIII bacterium]|jgi:sarcosine oxidase subunit beta|nr:FAD-binding oxidoreductase [Clostridiales Family XIII bacterium]